jgi:hypothetical protein
MKQADLLALIAKWRKDAEMRGYDDYDSGKAYQLEECADELAAIVTPKRAQRTDPESERPEASPREIALESHGTTVASDEVGERTCYSVSTRCLPPSPLSPLVWSPWWSDW